MSENLIRSTKGFSKYDSMSIEELEEILRADAQGPERDDSDVGEILYVMEVLAKKRRQNGIAGKTALEAYQEFQQYYLPMVEEESKPKRKSNIIPFRRIAAVAACLVLVFSFATSAYAFGWKDIWNAVAKWAEETFSFSIGEEVRDPKAGDMLLYNSLQEALLDNEEDSSIVPTWIPASYVLTNIRIERTPLQETFLAIYMNGDTMLKLSVQHYLTNSPEQIEADDNLLEIYPKHDTDYYIFKNYAQHQAVWINGEYECYISGEIDIDSLKQMIESIEKD